MADALHLDYETRSEIDLKKVGLDVYSAHPSTQILMGAWAFGQGEVCHWEGPNIPREVAEALADPEVEKRAFNAQFERVITRRVAKIKTPVKNWRCTMVKAFSQSYFGTLEMIGAQIGLERDKLKDKRGSALIKLFSAPQKITRKQPNRWNDSFTNPNEWDEFCEYNIQDVVAEREIWNWLDQYEMGPHEWDLYELDQIINDRGLPIDIQFVRNAIQMANRRKAELTASLKRVTGVDNPNSPQQLLPWLKERGYRFDDLQKASIEKSITEAKEGVGDLTKPAVKVLGMRRQVARTSVKKYDAVERALGPGDRFRFGFQMNGASRTGRWAGRRYQPHNLARTPKDLEADFLLEAVTEVIRQGDYEALNLYTSEPMEALAGVARSAIRAEDGYELRPADLSAIETCVIAWIAGCERMLEVIRSGKDPYKDFGTELYQKAYDDITKKERTDSKPAVLGCGYRLGGGDLKDGKKTGLWGYAENMKINLSKEESHRAVKIFRRAYPEYPKLWYALEEAVKHTVKTKRACVPTFTIDGRKVTVPVRMEFKAPYLIIRLPNGRPLYYKNPRIEKRALPGVKDDDGNQVFKDNLTYMGQIQGTRKWGRISSHGGKITENIVQAIARDVLAIILRRAHKDGFYLVGHVHDEAIPVARKGDNYFTVERMIELMKRPIRWAPGLPLGAAGWSGPFYKKD